MYQAACATAFLLKKHILCFNYVFTVLQKCKTMLTFYEIILRGTVICIAVVTAWEDESGVVIQLDVVIISLSQVVNGFS